HGARARHRRRHACRGAFGFTSDRELPRHRRDGDRPLRRRGRGARPAELVDERVPEEAGARWAEAPGRARCGLTKRWCSMTPFEEFRLWLRQGAPFERAGAAIAVLIVLVLVVWVAVPTHDSSSGTQVGA